MTEEFVANHRYVLEREDFQRVARYAVLGRPNSPLKRRLVVLALAPLAVVAIRYFTDGQMSLTVAILGGLLGAAIMAAIGYMYVHFQVRKKTGELMQKMPAGVPIDLQLSGAGYRLASGGFSINIAWDEISDVRPLNDLMLMVGVDDADDFVAVAIPRAGEEFLAKLRHLWENAPATLGADSTAQSAATSG